jgi:hypothetical protein
MYGSRFSERSHPSHKQRVERELAADERESGNANRKVLRVIEQAPVLWRVVPETAQLACGYK